LGYTDGLNLEEQGSMVDIDMLEIVFLDGKLVREQSLSEIRNNLLAASI
jgi:nicotinamide phosphoribosyltransferase